MKNVWKKLMACALAAVLVVGMIPAPAQAASTHEGGTIQAEQVIAPVYNQAVFDYLKTLNDNMIAPPGYVTIDSPSGSVGPLFRADSYQGHTQALSYNGGSEYNLVTSTKMRDRTTRWIMSSKPVWYEEYVKTNPDVKMRLGGKLVNGASMSIATYSAKDTALGTHKGQSGKTITTFTDVPLGDVLNTTGVIENPYIALVDDAAPAITGVSGDLNQITVHFDEALRWANGRADGSLGEFTLTVKLANAISGVESGTLTYCGYQVDLKAGEVRFQRTSEAPPAGTYKVVEITASTNGAKDETFEVYGIKQCWRYSIGTNTEHGPNYGKHIYSEPYVNNGIKLMGELENMPPLTDFAGNAVELPGKLDLRQYNITFDNAAPVLEEVYLTGDMITEESSTPKDQWASDTDLSSLYAGVGDKLYFNLKFNEVMREVSGQSITLNVMSGGKNVTLSDPAVITGTNASGETCTVLRFGPFAPAQGMTMATGFEGQTIGVTALNGTYDDLAYNDWGGAIPGCSQGIYLDTVAPAVTAELMSGAGDREFTVKLTVADETSGFIGLNGKVGLSAAAEGGVDYQYALNDNLSADSAVYTKSDVALGGGKVSWHDIDLYNGTRYLHIKLPGNGDITLEGLKVHYQISDWAGNMSDSASAVEDYSIDEKAPVVTAPLISVTYSAQSARVTGASWTASDYNADDGLTAYYQWSESKPADYAAGWSSAGKLASGFVWELPESVYPAFTETTNTNLWVYVEDAAGNKSAMTSAACSVNLDKAVTNFVLESDPLLPTGDPALWVTANGKGTANGERTAYTYATITFDNKSYVVKVPSAEGKVDLFPVTRSVTDAGGDTLTADAFNDLLNKWYGEVTVSFESAFQDVQLNAGGDLAALVNDGSYGGKEGNVTFRYAPKLANVHGLDIVGKDKLDSAENSLLFYQTLKGQSVTLEMTNLLQPDWGLSDVDPDNSFLSLELDGDAVYTIGLSAAASQTITLPDLDYSTGAYTITAQVASRAGSVTTAELGIALVVDNEKPKNVGVWEAYITPGMSLGYDQSVTQYDENGMPILSFGSTIPRYLYDFSAYVMEKTGDKDTGEYIESLTLNMAGQRETLRSDTHTAEISGIQNFGFTISADNTTQTIEGQEVGALKAFYLWNPALRPNGPTEEDRMIGTSFVYNSAEATDHYDWTYDETTGIGTAVPRMDENGYYAMASDIGLKPGTTTLCYQVVMENGQVSPVYSLELHTTTETPTANLNTRVYEVNDTPEVESDIVKADVSLQNTFAANGLHEIAWLTKGDAVVDGVGYPKMSRSDLLEKIRNGYYGEEYRDVSLHSGSSAPTTDNVLSNPNYASYRYLPVADDAQGVVTLNAQGNESYNTQGTGSDSCVTYKWDMYSAGGAFLLMDESGGTTMLFPQFTMEDNYGDTGPNVAGYTPEYTLVDKALAFFTTPAISQSTSDTITANVRNLQYLDADKSTITFVYGDGTENTYPLLDTVAPNADGFVGAYLDEAEKEIRFYPAGPVTTDPNLAGKSYDPGVTIRMELYDSNLDTFITDSLKEYNSDYTQTVSVNITGLKYASATPSVSTGWYENGGVRLYWYNPVQLDGETKYSEQWILPIFKNGTYTVSFTDAFGNRFEDIPFEVTGYDGPDVAIDNLNRTSRPVTVDVTIPEGAVYSEVYVSADTSTTVISGSGTASVTAEVAEPTMLTISWSGQSKEVGISNVYPVEPTVIWSYGESADEYTGGDVTAYVVDASGNWELIDPLTGEMPSFTFTGESGLTEYMFASISTGEKNEDGSHVYLDAVTAELEVTVKETELPPVSADTRAPSVQLVPYAVQNGIVMPREMILRLEDIEGASETDPANPGLTPYTEADGYTTYSDSAAFTDALGWASFFRFQIEVQDRSKTKLLLKNGLYAEEPASYADAAGEAVANVTLNGSTLEVNGSAQFTLFVMDAEDNCTVIPMNVYNVGQAPVPTYTKVPDGSNAVEVVLNAPEGVTDLKITGVDGTAAERAVFTANGVHTIAYSYTYQNRTVTGTLQVSISEVDNAAPYLLNTKWSANSAGPTNQDVTVTLTFSKKITRVQSDITPDTVKVLLSGDTATVRYSGNTPAMNLCFQSVNGMMTDVVELPEVGNIDRTPPVITASEPVVSKDGKRAEIIFTADERVSFREGSQVGESFNRTVKENGAYTFNFADMVGNTVAVSVRVEGVVTEALTMQFSLDANGSGAADSPEALGDLALGDSFYVSLNRAATIDFDLAKHEYTSGWMKLVLGDKSGGAIGATDVYGNTVSAVFPNIIYPDVTAPAMELSQYTIHVSDSITAAELEQMLLDNLQTVDDRGGTVTKTVTMPNAIAAGDHTVTYTARDEAGNEATIPGRVMIYTGAVPSVWLDGEFVERERIYLADGDDPLQLRVDMQGQPYSVVYKKNIKTVAQMKTGATELELTDNTVQLPFHGTPGYYTVCVTMQDRDQYRIVIFIQ